MKILVTGANGYLGQGVVKALLDNGHNVVATDFKTTYVDPQAICEELENMGYEVDCFDDRPSTNGMVKAIIRVNKDLIGRYINRYFKEVMKTVRGKKYDVVFLISGQSLSFSEDMMRDVSLMSRLQLRAICLMLRVPAFWTRSLAAW